MLKDRLTKLRKQSKKTQGEVAKVIGVSRPAYTAYEKGNRTPDYKTLTTLADYYNVTTDYLLGRDGDQDNDEETKRDKVINKIATEFPDIDLMFEDLSNMTSDDLEDVYEYIKFKMSKK
ncbi:helix-turn-helix domain-containing protein [Virgibacillus salexigens]|uniref:helix-turn-helix domain-containing protein n=1 Tax=Virgibacillus salexigens TaxID=61016 RepID=UPI00190D0A2D|nr:helix-turn-helix transcriptional regulator [Virgibacillus salexigens]